MRAHYFEKYGVKSGKIGDLPDPTIGPEQILVEIHAASVNPIDYKIRDGKLKFLRRESFPMILGGDGAGLVVSVGDQVSRFKPGDSVYFRVPKSGPGSFAEKIALPESCVGKTPKSLSLLESAALPLVSLTAMQAFFDVAKLTPGQKVFVPAGSGGVGSHAIQIAKANGLYVATTTSTKNLDRVKKLGADRVIDYTKEDFTLELKDFDAVFDTLGGKEQKRAFGILKKGGILVSIVSPPTLQTAREFRLGIFKSLILVVISLPAHLCAWRNGARYSYWFMKPNGLQLERLAEWVDAGKVKPIIDRTFTFDQIDAALAYVVSGKARGKVLIGIRTALGS